MWILIALVAPACYGIACVFDSTLTNKSFKNPFVLIFFSCISNALFIPLLFIFQKPVIPPFSALPILLLLGIINISYLYPYYKGLQNDDTSTVISFFGIGRIFIPILAFIIVGEVLSFQQYMGITLIVISIILLSIQRVTNGIKLSKALGYIIGAAFILSFEGVLLKYLFNLGIPVSTAIAGELIVPIIISFCFLFVKSIRQEIKANNHLFLKKIHIFITEEMFTFFAFTAESYAIDMAPVSLVKSITIFTPFFILFYSKIFKRKFVGVFNEEKGLLPSLKKVLLFTSLSIGILMILN